MELFFTLVCDGAADLKWKLCGMSCIVGGDISGGKKACSKKIFCNLTNVRALNKTVVITSLQHYSL